MWHGITAAAQCVSQKFRFGPMDIFCRYLEPSKKCLARKFGSGFMTFGDI